MSDLDRFVAAQAEIYPQALAELQAGRKQSHWMWFVFPQIAGLGRSPTAHLLRDRLRRRGARLSCPSPARRPAASNAPQAVLAHRGRSAEAIFGAVDAMKLKSSMTLFEAVADDPAPFASVLDAFFDAERDPATLMLLDG